MKKVYSVNFKQSFEETRTVFAESEDDARDKLTDSWSSGDIEVFGVELISETTEGHSEDI